MRRISASVWVVGWLVACGPQTPGGSGEGTAVTTGSAESSGSAETAVVPTTSGGGPAGSSGPSGATSTGNGGSSGGDGGTSSSGSSAGVGGSTTEGRSTGEAMTGEVSSSGEAVEAGCPGSDWAEGCPAVDCQKQSCGGLFDKYDEQGVRRKGCDVVTCCETGFECFRPFDWGGCVPSLWGCGFQSEDCGGAYCVPKALNPPPIACGGTDEASCVASGCSFVLAPWFAKTGKDCECGEAAPLCLWFSEPVTSVDEPTAYYEEFGVNVRVLQQAWSAPPHGYKPCAGDPDAPAGCGCVDSCVP